MTFCRAGAEIESLTFVSSRPLSSGLQELTTQVPASLPLHKSTISPSWARGSERASREKSNPEPFPFS
jgi:hypothetical protein